MKRGEANQWKRWKKPCEKEMRTSAEENVNENDDMKQLWVCWNTAYRRAVDGSVDWRRRGVARSY